MLHAFITAHRDELVARARARVVARRSPPVTEAESTNGVPIFLAQLVDALRPSLSVGGPEMSDRGSSPELDDRASAHGRDLMRMGFTLGQVVQGYGDVCQAITELAFETHARITIDEFHTLNRCLDDATSNAVTAFAFQQEEANAKTATERRGALAHELRNLIATATLSFDIMKSGTVPVGGSTGAIHDRALKGLRALVNRSLAEVRLDAGIAHREALSVRDFTQEIAMTATLEAAAGGHRLTVIGPSEPDLLIDADRHILASVLSNLLQNAFKFSHHHANIVLRTHCSSDRVMIDVEDECGGLPTGRAERFFTPFDRRGPNRSGLGLGLAISRDGARANGGELRVRDVPGHGCVFTVDLPRRNVPPASGSPDRAA